MDEVYCEECGEVCEEGDFLCEECTEALGDD